MQEINDLTIKPYTYKFKRDNYNLMQDITQLKSEIDQHFQKVSYQAPAPLNFDFGNKENLYKY